MKKWVFTASMVLLIGALFYANNRFGLLSMAGLNGKGLPAKVVKGSLAYTPAISSVEIDYAEWSKLLKKHVDDEGLVDYKGFLKDKSKLDDFLIALATQVPTNDWTVQEQLAYYINLYNAQTVNLILRNYPLKSIKDIDGPWTKDFIKIGKKELSLGALEHSILRKMNEPRIHFAINCASASCPKLSNVAYTPEKLEEQLEQAAHDFITSKKNGISQDLLKLSRIFKWFKGDFKEGDVLLFIKSYTGININPKAKIKYLEYD